MPYKNPVYLASNSFSNKYFNLSGYGKNLKSWTFSSFFFLVSFDTPIAPP